MSIFLPPPSSHGRYVTIADWRDQLGIDERNGHIEGNKPDYDDSVPIRD